jgi:hypothetical protein
MEENKIWSNLNDSYNLEIILAENKALKNYIPKRDIIKKEVIIKKESNVDTLDIYNDILTTSYNEDNILQIIAKQNTVISYLLKIFRTTKSEDNSWNKYRNGLVWILESSKFIVSKSGAITQFFKTDKIYRSSYKFCNKKDECEITYCHIIKPGTQSNFICKNDHYVHNKIISDLTCLINVIDEKQNKKTEYSMPITNDLRICLDTLNFVINHMYQELNNYNIYYSKQEGFDINKCYVVLKKTNKV